MAAKKKAAKTGEVWPVTVYLLKPSISKIKDALHKNAKSLPIHPVAGIGSLVLKEAFPVRPKWVERLAHLVPAAGALRQQSPGAVLFVNAGVRVFAVTYGYGRSLIAPEAVVHDFGIRVVLNSVESKHIRSLDSRTLEISPQLSRKQFVEERPLAAFALDRMHDLLKGVTARAKSSVPLFNETLITGTDSLQCKVKLASANEIVKQCGAFLTLYNKKDYTNEFAFIDHVRFVRAPVDVKKLDASLHDIATSKPNDIGFAPPRLLNGEELSRLRCSWTKSVPPGEVHPKVIRDHITDLAKKILNPAIFVERLKHDRIELVDATGEVPDHWSLYRCLLVESLSTNVHILTTGDWYSIAKDYVAEISNRFDKIVLDSASSCPITLPKQKASHKTEGEYNDDAGKALKLDVLDKKNMMKKTGASGVEPCDIIDAHNGIFVHVKIGRRSATLSHLFNQGLVSTTTFLDEERARDNVRDFVSLPAKAAKIFEPGVQGSHLTTVFAIIDKPAKAKSVWRLPFFSMLVATSVTDRLTRRGVQVHTVRVDAA